eukprot:TRINITY_DN11928_c0_g1_i1.p1 TRINITY_DN11928_c0_g1~~TRINITY_DN11928_c0_g1_i1.p1  ORF type:complete len:372 (+),score=88.69 TRINITY_DN11928_c0_g1_i1:51-1166(+)
MASQERKSTGLLRPLSLKMTSSMLDVTLGDSSLSSSTATATPTTSTPKYDRFGFETAVDAPVVETDPRREKKRREKESSREKKWVEMLSDWEKFLAKKPEKVLSRLRKGVPGKLRAKVWKLVLRCDNTLENPTQIYKDLLALSSPHEATIEADIREAFPNHALFREYNGYNSLFNVLKVYSLHDKDVGYNHWLGIIVGMFLIYMTEEEAFQTLATLMKDKGIYKLRTIYISGAPGLELSLFQMSRLLESHIPQVFQHLSSHNIEASHFLSEWFLGSFIVGFQFELALRVWDSYLASGRIVFFKVALGILSVMQGKLLKLDSEQTVERLSNMHTCGLDPDAVMEASESFSISYVALQQLEFEYQSVKQLLSK